MWTIIKVFYLKFTSFSTYLFKKHFTFLTEGYTVKMARMINLCLMLIPKCKKITSIIFRRRQKMRVLAFIQFHGRSNIREIHRIHEN